MLWKLNLLDGVMFELDPTARILKLTLIDELYCSIRLSICFCILILTIQKLVLSDKGKN